MISDSTDDIADNISQSLLSILSKNKNKTIALNTLFTKKI